MQLRGLLIAVVVLAVLGAGIWWSNRQKAAEEGKPAADATPKILSVPEDQIQKVQIEKTGGEPIVLSKEGGKWQITAPKALPADPDTVSSLVNTLSSLSSDRLVEEKTADLSPYGLKSPPLTVTVTRKDGKTEKVLVGDETPTGSAFYAKALNDPRIFTIASYSKTSIDKTPRDLRDKRMLTFDSDKLSRVEVRSKGQAFEFGKNNQNEWQIVRPRPLRADNGQVEELVRKLREAKMDTVIPEDEEAKANLQFAGAALVGTAAVTDASGSQQIEVRKDKDNHYLAKSSVVESAYRLTGDLGEALGKGLDDYRNRKLFDFGFNDPGKVEMRDGTKAYSLQKSGEKWTSGGKEMNPTSVQTLIDKLRDLSATKFVESGFTTPAMEITVTSNDGKRVEKVLIAQSGTNFVAKRENEPALYELDAKSVAELQKDAADIKAPPPPAKDQKK